MSTKTSESTFSVHRSANSPFNLGSCQRALGKVEEIPVAGTDLGSSCDGLPHLDVQIGRLPFGYKNQSQAGQGLLVEVINSGV